MIYFITGGERSGKSRFAQQLALDMTQNPTYLATARHWDQDFEKRIKHHQQERDDRWINIEEEIRIGDVVTKSSVILLDCVTLWLTNIFSDRNYEVESSLTFAKVELAKAFSLEKNWIVVSNEIGMGVHATTDIGRKFVELQGWINQHIAKHADDVYLMISGIPLKIKPQRSNP